MNVAAITGAVNPLALAEVVLGRKINWRRVANPEKLLARILETPLEDLFDGNRGSPIFALQQAIRRLYAERDMPRVGDPDFPIPGLDDIQLRQDISIELEKKVKAALLALYTETEYPGASWQDIGDFFEEGTEFADPIQGAIGDCWLISALASVAWSRPYAIVHRNRTTGASQGDFVDAIDIQSTATETATIEVGEKIPVWDGGNFPLYGRSSEAGEIWPGLYEKAFAKLRTSNQTDKPNFAALNGGDCVDASARLVPGLKAKYYATAPSSADQLWSTLIANSIGNPGNSGRLIFERAGRTVNPMTAWTYAVSSDAPDSIDYGPSGIVAWHCYSVLGWIAPTVRLLRDSIRYIVLRNPWGFHEGVVDVYDGNWNANDQGWMRSTPLNANGVFAMEIKTFRRYFAGLGVAA